MKQRRNLWPFGDSTKTVTVYKRRSASKLKGGKYRTYRIWEDADGWHTSLDPGSWFDSQRDVKRFIDSWDKGNPALMSAQASRYPGFHPNPSEGWFDRCRKNILPLPGVAELSSVGQFAGEIQKRLKKSRGNGGHVSKRKRNPEAESATAFEQFHGFAPTEQVVVDKHVRYHSQLWAVGILEKLTVVTPEGDKVDLSGFEGALLSGNERMTQLYVEGGEQDVDLAEFGIEEPYKDKEELGKVEKLYYFTNKAHLGDQGGEAIYHHTLGEEEKRRKVRIKAQPTLVYDVLNKSLEFIGGKYTIEPEGIRN